MNFNYKTTKNNPASFQKVPDLSLIIVFKKTVKLIMNGEYIYSFNFFISQLINIVFGLIKSQKYFYCNLCKSKLSFFLHTSTSYKILFNSICPNCSSRKRHRGLYELYREQLKQYKSLKILHFAPEPVFYDIFNSFDYIKTDLMLEDVDIKLDIENIDYEDNSFDLILCNHVLEHVNNDKKALEELKRILNPMGKVIITVPGNWKRKKTIEYIIPDRNGHYREYGLDYIKKLNTIFDKTESIDLYRYNKFYDLSLGLTPLHDIAFVCQKK